VLAPLALALGACTGTTGTITLDLGAAPDSHLLDAVQRLRVTITDPHQVVEATRTASGFDLALEVDATATNGALIIEGFDASGARIACGQSPRFPVAAINAHVVVYMAAPRSIAVSPARVSAARAGAAAAPISLGAVVAGGIEATGAPSTATAVYNAFDHSLVEGIPLPAPRGGMAMASGASGGVYMFGGTGPGGQPAGTLWRFDTTVAPNGAFATITDQAGYARTGALIVPIGAEHYLITGTPALELSAGMLTARSDVAGLPAAGAGVVPGDGTPTAIFAGDAIVRFRGNAFATLPGDSPLPHDGAAAVTLPDGRIAVIGGTASRDVLVVDAAAGTVTAVPGVLSTARIHPAVATTSRHVVITGGLTPEGAPISTADVLDARTLALLATLPMRTGSGGFAIALPNDQVLLGGGTPALPLYELFTPEPPT
jgi:hypothetical protein